MASYEVQGNSPKGWQIVAIFDTYELAYGCARRIDRKGQFDELRVTREVLDPQTGRFRATTLYKCGQKIRDEIARELEESERLAAVEKRQDRLNRKVARGWSFKASKVAVRSKERLASRSHPLQIAFWTTVLFSAGMAAVYYFEFVLIYR